MSAILEFLFLAFVCVLVFYRLFTVLGTRVGTERDRSSPFDQQKGKDMAKEAPESASEDILEADYTPARARRAGRARDFTQELAQIRVIDPKFSLEAFTQGAEKAFRMILEAFAAGDKETLKGLLSREVYASFLNVLAQRSQDQAMTTEITDLEGEITRIQVNKKGKTLEATLTVAFESRQKHTLTLKDGSVRSEEQACTDIWTFQRTLASQDPTWVLIQTQDPDEGS